MRRGRGFRERVSGWAAEETALVQHQRREKAQLAVDRAGQPAVMLGPGATLPWRDWASRYFPNTTRHPYGERHVRLWDWAEGLAPDVRPRPEVSPWPRGGGKSTTGELVAARLGCTLKRRFVLYVSESQTQADEHVRAIGGRFEALGLGRALNKYGVAKGWRRNQLRTENGFNVAAFGLLSGARGVKLDDFRPDLIIFDDIDGRLDTPKTTEKKISIITETLLPAGSSDLAVLFLQNLIIPDGIVSQLVDGRAEFLMDRRASPPEPAMRDLAFERAFRDDGTAFWRITGGEPTWAGQDRATCEFQMNLWGRRAFLREAQHRVREEEGGLWDRARDIEPFRVVQHPTLSRVIVAVDPSVGDGSGDACGIMVIAAGWLPAEGGRRKQHAYLLADKTLNGSPATWAKEVAAACHTFHATEVVAESNQGGTLVEAVLKTEDGIPPITLVHASDNKITRAEPVQKCAENGLIHHVGTFKELERELCTWKRGDASPNRLDAYVWGVTALKLEDQSWAHSEDALARLLAMNGIKP